MIKISINVEDFNRINKFGKNYTGKNRNLQYMRFTILNNTLTAEGLDGYKFFKISKKIDNLNGVDGVFYMNTMKNFKKSDRYITIEESEKFINLQTNSENRYIEKKEVNFFDTKNIIDDKNNSSFNIRFNAKKLSEALTPYSNENIELMFTDKHKMVVITSGETVSMVLPLRYIGRKKER